MAKRNDANLKKNYIFGAKATAVGLYKALSVLHPELRVEAFVVSELGGNPDEILGCSVRRLDAVSAELSEEDKEHTRVYVAVPELIHREIRRLLNGHGFNDLVMLDSHTEIEIMEKYFQKTGRFKSLHLLGTADHGNAMPKVTMYVATFYKDSPLDNPPQLLDYMKKLYLGCDGAIKAGVDISDKADFFDNTGDNISAKNPNRCEMTAHYWIWKNRLDTDDEYVGICHYRRMLDLTAEDLIKIKQNNVDVVLPYPMFHYPNCGIHHTWYVPEQDWELMISVLNELYPEYADRFDEVFDAPEFYNYNMMLAKKKVFSDYCEWLYPILDRIEELSQPKGTERKDRYTAYMSESLTTLYFMVNLKKLKIYHTGRLLYT